MCRRTRFGLALVAALGLVAALLFPGCGGSDSGSPPPSPAQTAFSLTSLLGSAQHDATTVGARACSDCHGSAASRHRSLGRSMGRQTGTQTQLTDIFDSWMETTHASKGITCESCHGPGSAHIANPYDPNTIVGFPNITSSLVCGQCHNAHSSLDLAQFDEWSQSTHRKMVDAVLQEGEANPNVYVKTCFRCHNSRFKAEVVERGVDVNSLTSDQLAEFAQFATDQTSGNDPLGLVSTVNCAGCHDPHRKTGNVTNRDGDDSQVRRALVVAPDSPEVSKIGPGSTPDQYTSINHVCAQCHNGRGTDPSDAALKKNTARPPMHDSPQFNMLVGEGGVETSGGPLRRTTTHAATPQQCATCHMGGGGSGLETHTFTVKLDACSPCHTQSDAAQRRVATQDDITGQLLNVRSRLQAWAMTTAGDPNGWEYSTQGGPQNQSAVPLAIQRARYNYYFVIRDKSFGIHNAAYTRYLLSVANQQLDSLNVAPTPARARGRSLATERIQMLHPFSPRDYPQAWLE